jgi:hypothetical protein
MGGWLAIGSNVTSILAWSKSVESVESGTRVGVCCTDFYWSLGLELVCAVLSSTKCVKQRAEAAVAEAYGQFRNPKWNVHRWKPGSCYQAMAVKTWHILFVNVSNKSSYQTKPRLQSCVLWWLITLNIVPIHHSPIILLQNINKKKYYGQCEFMQFQSWYIKSTLPLAYWFSDAILMENSNIPQPTGIICKS